MPSKAATAASPRKPKSKPKGLTVTKIYLILFNTLSTLAWLRVLVLSVWFILTPRTTTPGWQILGQSARHGQVPWKYVAAAADHLSGSYDFHGLGEWVKWTQTLAIMEVVHAALGLVRSPVGTVASQVASRLWAVWGVVEMVPETHNHPLFTTMVTAWSLAELVRYPLYALGLLNIEVYALNWLRYTLFLVLYPVGASSEAFLSFSTLPPLRTLPYIPRVLHYFHSAVHALPKPLIRTMMNTAPGRSLLWSIAQARAAKATGGVKWTPIQVARLVLFFIWWPALYVLYTYMLKQRRKFFSKSKIVGGANKAN